MSPIQPDRFAVLDTLVLKAGGHSSFEAGACVMEAAAYVAGRAHTDSPPCVSPVIATFLRLWNDNLPDDETRTRLLRPLIPVVLDTATTPEDDMRRSWMAFDWLVRVHAPAWMDLTDALKPHAANLRALPEIDSKPALELAMSALQEARSASAAASDAAGAAAGDAARGAAQDAARAAAGDAARGAAQDAARGAAGDAAGAAARAAAWGAARAAAGAAASAAARGAAQDAARAAAQDAAWGAAQDAAWGALAPTTATLQAPAVELVKRMAAVGR